MMDAALPIFEPIEDCEALTDSNIKSACLENVDPDIQVAETACKAGQIMCATQYIERLLQAGILVQHLQGCLLGAVESVSDGLVQLLLATGVPITSLVIKPALEAKNIRVLSLFLEYGWDLNQEEAWCIPPWLSLAIATDADHSLISWCLCNGADPNAACQIDTTPLSTAVASAPLSNVKQLLEHCPDNTSFRGQLLHFAARRTDNDSGEVLKLVLSRCQPKVNAIMWEDDPLAYECYKLTGLGTALQEAARMGLPKVAEMLLTEGVDISIRDSCGRTALEAADMVNNHAVADYLRNAEAKQKNARDAKM